LKPKTTTQETTQLVEKASAISLEEDNGVFASLATSLAEIRKLKGVHGYILRGTSSAVIDLAEKDKVIDYAMLSSQIEEAYRGMAKSFKLTSVESVLVEGKTVKVLCMSVGGNKMSIFMDKTATHSWIIKRILL
jgi:predicted regulator of Ras-like GTPase activity (Roadblock/LC7/MglB family)